MENLLSIFNHAELEIKVMIKRIAVKNLQVGMYISNLNNDWIPHNSIKKKGIIRSELVIDKVTKLGISELYIDTSKGKDHQDAIPFSEVESANQEKVEKVSGLTPHCKPTVSLADEMIVASRVHEEAIGQINNIKEDVKLGKAINLSPVDELVDSMLNSILRNHHALTCLGCIRDKDAYLMEHSVNLSVLMSVYGSSMNFSLDTLHKTMLGALLHDIGKVMVPDKILHKPSCLTSVEFSVMKQHVTLGRDMLKSIDGFPQLSLTTMAEHHERIDGSGYPEGLKGDEISQYGKMAAIIDVYDAITAERSYHKGMTPTQGIKKLLEWSENHLDKALVYHFIRCIGIYPVGSLVLLESGRLGVVIESNEFDQRLPTIRTMYNSKSRSYITTEVIDLAQAKVQDRIVKAVEPSDYLIQVKRFL